MEITEHVLAEIIQKGIEVGTVATLVKLGQIKPYMSYNEATAAVGRGLIDRWVSEGLLEKVKDGEKNSKVRFDRLRVMTLMATSNRMSWFRYHKKEE